MSSWHFSGLVLVCAGEVCYIKHMLKKYLSIALLLMGIFSISGCAGGGTSNTEVKTYKIGVITSLTGTQAELGQEQKKILDYRLEDINRNGKYKIELVYEDGQCDIAAAEAMRQLLQENLKFVIGGVCAAATFAAAPVANGNDMVLLSATTANEDLEGKNPHVLSLSYPEKIAAIAVADELLKYKKFATLSEKTDEAGNLEKMLDDYLYAEKKDSGMVYDQKFERGAVDFASQIKQIQQSGAEALFLNPSSKESSDALLKALDQAKFSGKLIGQFSYDNANLVEEAPAIVNGMVVIDNPTVNSAEFEKYKQQIINAKGDLPQMSDYYIASTMDALDILSKLVAENDGDFFSVLNALDTGTFTGYIGKIHFGGKTFVEGSKARRQVVASGALQEG